MLAMGAAAGPSSCQPLPRDAVRTISCRGTAHSLVAFDVDKTVLHQGDPQELQRFRSEGGLAQTLVRLARLDFRLAAITGNSLLQLITRFLRAVVEELCEQKALHLLTRFHFFCNGAALYIHFDPQRSEDFAALLARAPELDTETLFAEAKRCLLDNEQRSVRPNFIFSSYARQCCIPEEDAERILGICSDEAQAWWNSVSSDGQITEELQERFYIDDDPCKTSELEAEAEADHINKEASVFTPGQGPEVLKRSSGAADGKQYILACNVLPVLSHRHARNELLTSDADPRQMLIRRIRERMRQAGLARYMVTAGGRSTVDISHHLVSKRSALLWLLRHLGVEGVEQLGEPMGVNTIYFGDEVVLHGNDLPVAEVPGILVFAVNELKSRVPFRTNVELPTAFSEHTGPEATQAVLESLAKYAEECFEAGGAEPWSGVSAVLAWKKRRLQGHLRQRCELLTDSRQEGPDNRITYRRLEAAVAALTALTRQGAGLDDFAQEVIDLADSIGRVAMHVRENEFQHVHALALKPPRMDSREEEGMLEELELERTLSK